MNSTAIASPEWGHPLLTPEGKEIRVPAFAFEKLRKLGLLAHGRAQLSPMAYQMLDPDYDCITEGLRQLLGGDLTGPKWLVCRCLECQQFEGELDKTLTPAEYQMRRQEELELILQDVKRKRRRTR